MTPRDKMELMTLLEELLAQYLKLTGGELSGALTVANTLKVRGPSYSNMTILNTSSNRSQGIQVSGNDVFLSNLKDTSNTTALYLYDENNEHYLTLRVLKDGVDNYYRLFSEHNKPSGSYTGNGDATLREIAVGGIGKVLLIRNDTHGFAIVYSEGACVFDHTGYTFVPFAQCYYANGTLVLKTTNNVLNGSSSKSNYTDV